MHEKIRPERLLAAILSSADEALLTFALDGTVQTWSRGAEKLYGYAARKGDCSVRCGVLRIGVSVYPDNGRTAEDLLEAADRELYQHKRNSRARGASVT